jgi:hypothetical protein
MGMYDELILDERADDGSPLVCQTKAWERTLGTFRSGDEVPSVSRHRNRVDARSSYILEVSSTVEGYDRPTVYVLVVMNRIVSIGFDPITDRELDGLARFGEYETYVV